MIKYSGYWGCDADGRKTFLRPLGVMPSPGFPFPSGALDCVTGSLEWCLFDEDCVSRRVWVLWGQRRPDAGAGRQFRSIQQPDGRRRWNARDGMRRRRFLVPGRENSAIRAVSAFALRRLWPRPHANGPRLLLATSQVAFRALRLWGTAHSPSPENIRRPRRLGFCRA